MVLAAWAVEGVSQAAASSKTLVSLAFDDEAISQYSLAYQQALQPHGAPATFFVSSNTVGASAVFMSWAQLQVLAAAGNDIGAKAYGYNLTNNSAAQAQVCNDRYYLIQHGLTPAAFAYPGGAYDATAESIVKSCGYGNGRTAGGLSPTGHTYAETIPPANLFATRAYAPPTVTLANMESLVTGAASHGGGWDQIVIRRVCSQTLDPGNYSGCIASSGHVELADLNAFLDWVANAGLAGGAPTGTSLATVRGVVTSVDTTAPTTTIVCNGAPCSSAPYADPVSVTFPATDTGSSVSSTHYTTDGSDPALNSPTYSGVGPQAFTFKLVLNATTTVKFRSWDNAGHVEPVNTQVIQAPPDTTPPTTTASTAVNPCSCPASPYTMTVSLIAADSGGAGVANTYYTTDGSTPTTSSTAYTGPFTLTSPGTYNIEFFSIDKAGNAEQVQSKSLVVAPWTTRVSLTFDNGTVSQYNLGYLQALEPHGVHATFFVNASNIIGGPYMSWTQLRTLATAGDAIGGKTGTTNLTTDPIPADDVCGERRWMGQNGVTSTAFAYPGGAFNTSVEDIVKNCGYGNGRTAGSLSPAGPTYAESPYATGDVRPKNWLATRAYAPSGQLTLANMEALVTGAATHGGGWTQIVIGKVCSQTLDPANYNTCGQSGGHIELDDLNAFLSWMAAAGQPSGAPLGATLNTVSEVATSADADPPVTTIACNATPCSSTSYGGNVTVTFATTDVPSGAASTRYTTDGSDPTISSPVYVWPIAVTGTTTVKFRSWDNAGHIEATKSQVIQP
jgi:peptidoglycan/xylan/chitin deacetylase (PgdA/CDA1 family)